MQTIAISLGFVFIFTILSAAAHAEQDEPLNDDPLHEKAVQLARDGHYRQGLDILQKILDKDPHNYAVQRDYVIIANWMGDCDLALQRYQRIKHAPNQEAYLLLPVAECLDARQRREQAIALLQNGVKRWPRDEPLKNYLAELKHQQRLETAPLLELAAGNDTSDEGNVEWDFQVRYSHQFLQDTRAYLRYLIARADDPEFDTGDLNRVGAGVVHHLTHQWTFDVEASTDTKQSGEDGVTGTVVYEPTHLWELGARYATFAEDLPLRAKAQRVTAESANVFAGYHTEDYRWTWAGSVSAYDFSDENEKTAVYSELGYAHYLKPELEHRVILEFYTSDNTLEDPVYYNPERDRSVNLVHRTSVVYDSRFERHVDHFFIYLGDYYQQGFGNKPTNGFGFQQEYDFTDYSYFTWGASHASRVYDGNRERETHFFAAYAQKF